NGNKKIAVIENSTLKNQRVIKGELHNIIEKVKQEGIRPPAIIIIGDTVELHDKIGWYPIP
ncbi:MAG: HemD protein, partial [Candidatus Nitrosocosmicus sp.]